MKLKSLTILLFFSILSITEAQLINQERQFKQKKIKLFPVPTFGYSPETQAYLGAVTLMTFQLQNDSSTRASSMKIEFTYTQNNQMIMDNNWSLFTTKEKWYSEGYFHFSKYPDIYYGIGSDTKEIDQIKYNSNRIEFDINIFKKLKDNFFLGLLYRYKNWYEIYPLDYPDTIKLNSSYETIVNGTGLVFLLDKRNNILSPTKGKYLNILISLNNANSDLYIKSIIDVRFYKTFNKIHNFAIRYLGEFNSGNPPFFDLSLLGGDPKAKGYYYGRFRDNFLNTIQTEYRSKLIWRFGYSVFAGISRVSNYEQFLNLNYLKPNFGIGLRFLIDRKDNINLRFDYGIGIDGQKGFYIAFGESF